MASRLLPTPKQSDPLGPLDGDARRFMHIEMNVPIVHTDV
jgi:hypothetical protein